VGNRRAIAGFSALQRVTTAQGDRAGLGVETDDARFGTLELIASGLGGGGHRREHRQQSGESQVHVPILLCQSVKCSLNLRPFHGADAFPSRPAFTIRHPCISASTRFATQHSGARPRRAASFPARRSILPTATSISPP